LQNRWTVRWNIWKDIEGTGIVIFSGDSWKVYGNLFFHTTLASNQGIGQGCVGTWTGYSVTNAQVYNNTAVDLRLAPDTNTTGIYFSNTSSNTGNVAYNNIFYNCEALSLDTYLTHSYNAFSNASSGSLAESGTGQYNISSSIFTNYANDIFTLSTSTDPGMTLSAPYNTDMLGIYRGAGGVWDRGAYEYEGSPQTNIRYIRQGATGNNNGLDWTNAWTSIPTTLTRDFTYYIADGSFPSYTFDDGVDGSKYITIKKATVSDHGTGTGWNNAYGDGVTEFTSTVYFDTDYWIFDGTSGSGTTGHGFKVTTTSCTSGSKLINIRNGADYITVAHAELEHCGVDNGYSQDCVYAVNSTDGGSSNLTFRYCYMHHPNRVHFLCNYVTNSLIEYCYLSWRRDKSGGLDGIPGNAEDVHGETMSFN